jgi:hypothetical protein
MVDVFSTHVWIWTIDHVKAILRREKRENSRGDEPTWGTLYAYMEMSQQNPLYNCYILIKMLKK